MSEEGGGDGGGDGDGCASKLICKGGEDGEEGGKNKWLHANMRESEEGEEALVHRSRRKHDSIEVKREEDVEATCSVL